MTAPQCPGCGANAPTLRPAGLLLFVHEADRARLEALLTGTSHGEGRLCRGEEWPVIYPRVVAR
jgi:hypothetical protein